MTKTPEYPVGLTKRGSLPINLGVLWRHPKIFWPALLLVIFFVLGILAPWVSPYSPSTTDASRSLQGPSSLHWFGTDQFGRDTLSRLIYGARIATAVPIGAVLVSTSLGVTAGLLAARFKKVGDAILMRGADLLLAFPPIILALILLAFFDSGVAVLALTIGVLFTPRMARITYSAAEPVYRLPFVMIARVSGVGDAKIMFRYVLPNIVGPILVEISLELGFAIILESGLSFLGLGIQPPTPSWGRMVSDSRSFMDLVPSATIVPSIALVLFVLACNLLGDGLRDALDPRVKTA